MKVLVVEDDDALRAALLRLLAQWGYATEAASTAREARGWLERELFDLLMLDLGLPDGDGVSFCSALRRRPGHQPLVLMLTARDDRLEKVRGLEEGADDYVVKPFDPELLRALQRFTADASHELRHPLTALRTQLAAVPPELRQQPGLAWRELDRLSQRMGDLLDDLLLLARLEQAGLEGAAGPEEPQAFDLLELLEDLLRCYGPQAAAKAVALRLSPSPEHHRVPVRAQSAQLLRLFTNLLLNAIRHRTPGGTVALEVCTAGRQVRVAVADEGPGIPPQARERVFDRFWSGSDRGGQSGLGLAIAQAIARRHGGALRVGEGGGGCVLLVELPIAAPIS